MRIAVFDIGRKNFAFYVEEIEINKCNVLTQKFYALPKNKQRRFLGEMNEEVQSIHTELFQCGKRIKMDVVDLTDEDGDLNNEVRFNLRTFMNDHEELWNSVDVFVIEEQYYNPAAKFKAQRGVNKDAILLGESCYSYLIFNHHPKPIQYFKAALKTQTFGCPDTIMKTSRDGLRSVKKMTKYDRKKWAVQKANEIFTLRDDEEGLEQLKQGKQKKDDMSDCVIMCQAYIFKHLVLKV